VITREAQHKHNMPVLDKALFTGQEEAEVEDLKNAEVTNFGVSVKTALGRFGWKGQATGCVGLGLSTDNRRIETGRFITVGYLDEEDGKIEARKLWQKADSNVVVTMQFKQAEIFTFSDGTLCSDFVAGGNITHCLHVVKEGRRTICNESVLQSPWILFTYLVLDEINDMLCYVM
jgi:hypothetical protein